MADRFICFTRLRPGPSPQALQTPPRDGRPALRVIQPGPRVINPGFGYTPPSLRYSGTLTHLTAMLPRTHYRLLRPCAPHRYSHPPRGFLSDFSLHIGATGSHVPYRSLMIGSRRLYAGSRVVSKQVASTLIPGQRGVPGFDCHLITFRHFNSGSFALVSLSHT